MHGMSIESPEARLYHRGMSMTFKQPPLHGDPMKLLAPSPVPLEAAG